MGMAQDLAAIAKNYRVTQSAQEQAEIETTIASLADRVIAAASIGSINLQIDEKDEPQVYKALTTKSGLVFLKHPDRGFTVEVPRFGTAIIWWDSFATIEAEAQAILNPPTETQP